METRSPGLASVPACYLDWPGAAQAGRLVRRRATAKGTATSVVYLVTSLPRCRADAACLLALARRHWEVETLHFHRDVTWGEDASRTRRRSAPQALAALRNTALALLRRARLSPASALEDFAAARPAALRAALGLPTGWGRPTPPAFPLNPQSWRTLR